MPKSGDGFIVWRDEVSGIFWRHVSGFCSLDDIVLVIRQDRRDIKAMLGEVI